jgi:amino acid permease
MSLQLVGLTAAVVFCFTAISVFGYGRALWQDWTAIASVPNKLELLTPVFRAAFLFLASAATFLALLFGSFRNAARWAIGYVSVLLLLQLWLLFSWWQVSGQWFVGHHDPAFYVALGTKLLYLAWPVFLLVKVWPNYSFKATVMCRDDNLPPRAAP